MSIVNLSPLQLFNFSTVLPVGFVNPTYATGKPSPLIHLPGGEGNREPLTPHPSRFTRTKAAFTLAEVLITLGIIGVVAAMTLPALVQNYKKQAVETKLAKFYSTINQAIAQSEVENGSKMYWTPMSEITPEEWYNKYLKKYIKSLKSAKNNSLNNRFDIYFADGSLVTFSTEGWQFYPFAKDYEVVEKQEADGENYNDLNRKAGGVKLFSFMFTPHYNDAARKYHYQKGVEPYLIYWIKMQAILPHTVPLLYN